MLSTPHYISWLRVARVSRGLTQEELAEEAGISRVGLSKIESGRVDDPRRLTKRALSEVLDYEEDELFPPPGRRSTSRELREWAKVVYKRRRR